METEDQNEGDKTPCFSKLFFYKKNLGQGAFAKVFGAIDLEDHKECAVKVFYYLF